MIDTHAHLNFPPLLSQIGKVVTTSQVAGVNGIIIASSNLKDSQIALKLAQQYPDYLYASVGIHPQKTDPKNKMTVEKQLSKLERLLTDCCSLITAVGETGLDFSPAPENNEDRPKKDQIKLFQGHLKLAQKYNLPLIIHARKAIDEVIEILTSEQCSNVAMKGVFHCYAGGRKRIPKILDISGEWFFGFDGNLTYDEGLQSIIKLVPKERILIETDSPFLAPLPYRGQINTPAYLPLIQQKINQIFGQDLTQQIEENSRKLFNFNKKIAKSS